MTTVTLSLVSHTNVGKTTLARTLLRKDVGEVLDRAHVTDVSEAHVLAEAPGARLVLWDTPGFGDTARLLRRLRHEKDPLGWFLHHVWDRFADRPMWCGQQAVENVSKEADVVLYLVNAAEDPQHAGYPRQELEILSWIARPVLVLLNQTGAAGDDAAHVSRWRAFAAEWPVVKDVLPLDAFTRCWVEEGRLLERVRDVLPPEEAAAMEALTDAWSARNRDALLRSARHLSEHLARAASDRELLSAGAGGPGRSPLASLWHAVSGAVRRTSPAERDAMERLGERLRTSTERLVAGLLEAHGLDGRGAERIERRLEDFEKRGGSEASTRRGAAWGGLLGGALSGVAADIMSGGLTLGGGMIVGAIAGMLGGAGLAKTAEWVGGRREPALAWSMPFLEELFRHALLRYVAVAHFGRGRGEYRDDDEPGRWKEAVAAAAAAGAADRAAAWGAIRAAADRAPPDARPLERAVLAAMRASLRTLHPACARWIGPTAAEAVRTP